MALRRARLAAGPEPGTQMQDMGMDPQQKHWTQFTLQTAICVMEQTREGEP